MTLSPLFLLILGIPAVFPDSHTLRIYITGVSDRGSGLPEFSIVAYVDDQQIVNYNSDSRLLRRVAPWMHKVDSEFFDEQEWRCKRHESMINYDLRTLMSRFNQTRRFHSFQRMVGCELADDGSTAGYDQYGYNGKDLSYLDKERWIYIPTTHEAQLTTQRWNSQEVRLGEKRKIFLQKDCLEWLKDMIYYGSDDLKKRVPPEVKLIHQTSVGGTKLHCWVYGFHPRAVDVKWMINEQDEVPLYEATPILPNPDGSYQTKVTVEVSAGEEDNYSCHVDHSSLEETLIVKWESKHSLSVGGIIGGIFGCLVALAVVIGGVLIYKKKMSDYTTTNTSENSADSSNNPVTA